MIAVLLIPINGDPQSAFINGDLRSLQAIVGGYIEAVRLDRNTVLYCNEEGKLKGLTPNCIHPSGGDVLVGNLVIIGFDKEGNNISLSPAQAKKWNDKFRTLKMVLQ